MKANIIVFDNNSFLVAARQLMERGEMTLEQYAAMCRRQTLRN